MPWTGDKDGHKKANLKGRRKRVMCLEDNELEFCTTRDRKGKVKKVTIKNNKKEKPKRKERHKKEKKDKKNKFKKRGKKNEV